jgi:hypothetical protein
MEINVLVDLLQLVQHSEHVRGVSLNHSVIPSISVASPFQLPVFPLRVLLSTTLRDP